jgi:hypothetical protein
MTSETCLKLSLITWYAEHPDAWDIVRTINIGGEQIGVSRRILDWLVTNYAKRRSIRYVVDVGKGWEPFNMHSSYKSHLTAHNKKHFDPFRRGTLFAFDGTKEVPLDTGAPLTTIGQLNFFRWAYMYGVINYAISHKPEIKADMNSATKKTPESNYCYIYNTK